MSMLSGPVQGLYPIRVAIKLTGLTADTIRAWERRYGAIDPARTQGNTRMYSADDIRRLTLLKDAIARGHRIHEIATLSSDDLEKLGTIGAPLLPPAPSTGEAGDAAGPYRPLIEEYLAAVLRFDVRRSQQILSRAAALLNTLDFIQHLLLPILRQTGHQWEKNKLGVAHEHLVSMQARALLVRMTELVAAQPGSIKIVVTTPEGHLHEFGALVGALMAAGRGFEPIYLGPSLPEADILHAVSVSRANIILLSVVRGIDGRELDAFNTMLARLAAQVETWVGIGADHPAANAVPQVRYLTRFDELDLMLSRRFV